MAKDKEKSLGAKMEEELSYKKKNFFEEADEAKIKACYDYAVGYMKYIDDSKTEREAVKASIKSAEGALTFPLTSIIKLYSKGASSFRKYPTLVSSNCLFILFLPSFFRGFDFFCFFCFCVDNSLFSFDELFSFCNRFSFILLHQFCVPDKSMNLHYYTI